MKDIRNVFYGLGVVVIVFISACSTAETTATPNPNTVQEEENIPIIDLSHWKVTLPVGNPSEVEPPEILNYANIASLEKYMYNDTIEGSLVFFTEPGSTTANSSYSRTELREQMVPGSNNVNWTFEQGGNLKGSLRVARVSGEENNLDRIIVMQIHGRLTDEQRDLIEEDDNNAPPVLKIYWDDGKINVRRKILKDLSVSDIDILKKDAWTGESHWFTMPVGFDTFKLEIDVQSASMKIKLGEEEMLFNDIHVEKWGVFENYFKAGNYLQTTKTNSFSEIRYFKLEVKH